MVREIFDKIKNKEEIRKNLIELKAKLKEGQNKHALLYYIGTDFKIFYELLKDADAKVRKNTALIMGQLNVKEFMGKLYEAYEKEEQLFVKSAYLIALREYDYRSLLPQLKKRLEELSKVIPEMTDKKHIAEELKILSEMILSMDGMKHHEFTGYKEPLKLVLLTNRDHKDITMNQLNNLKAKEFNAGIILRTSNLKEILAIRTYKEVLFMLDDKTTCTNDIDEAAQTIVEGSFLEFFKKTHKGSAPFYFRIELKTKMDLGKKSAYTKKLAGEIERLSERKLVNSTSNYEVELRLIETKEGNFNILIKLFTLKDERFTYRKNTIPTSIQPVNAALLVALAKDYLKEDAQVMDPFCGVGTMLIERNKLVTANTMYGLDIYRDAIEKARENTQIAGAIVHYINRDFFDFKHEYLFDEIITNMPRAIGRKNEDEIFDIYERFFQKAKEHMKEGGIIILYSHNKDFVEKFMDSRSYLLEKEIVISRKEGAYLFVIKYM